MNVKLIHQFLSSLPRKPFYIERGDKFYKTSEIIGDEIGSKFFIGPLIGDDQVKVYWYNTSDRRGDDVPYYMGDVIRNFMDGTWVLKEFLESGISFKDFVKSIEDMPSSEDIFKKLNEDKSDEVTPKVGDYLYCHTKLIFEDGKQETTEGEIYKIIDTAHGFFGGERICILNDSKFPHWFTVSKEKSTSYREWFDLITKSEYDTMMSNVDDAFRLDEIAGGILKPKTGGYLYCVKTIKSETGTEFTKGKTYLITGIRKNKIITSNNSGQSRAISMEDDRFYFIPKEEHSNL